MKLDEKLVHLRKEKGLTQLELAETMQVSRQAVSKWEVGAAVPSTENLKYLGSLYDVSLEYLLYDDAPELTRVALESNKEESAKETKKKNRSIGLVLIVVGIVVVVLCVMLFGNKGEEPIPMENIEGSDMITVDDFEMDW